MIAAFHSPAVWNHHNICQEITPQVKGEGILQRSLNSYLTPGISNLDGYLLKD